MILCLDVGNTHIFGGVFDKETPLLQFRYSSATPSTSDQLGIFFKNVLRENGMLPENIQKVAICSVVPSLNYSIRSAFLKYLKLDPFFLREEDSNLTITFEKRDELGADRVSSAIAACAAYPKNNVVIIDFGTATTFDVITAHREYLGGFIIPGIFISMKALSENTAKLSTVDILKPSPIIGQDTGSQIQSGLYYSHLGAAREILSQISTSFHSDEQPVVIGTGGFAYLFEKENLFTAIIPELVLNGLLIACR